MRYETTKIRREFKRGEKCLLGKYDNTGINLKSCRRVVDDKRDGYSWIPSSYDSSHRERARAQDSRIHTVFKWRLNFLLHLQVPLLPLPAASRPSIQFSDLENILEITSRKYSLKVLINRDIQSTNLQLMDKILPGVTFSMGNWPPLPPIPTNKLANPGRLMVSTACQIDILYGRRK